VIGYPLVWSVFGLEEPGDGVLSAAPAVSVAAAKN
jgi:hypothetical protein